MTEGIALGTKTRLSGLNRTMTSLPSCYRHAGRETGLRCSDCDRPICADCSIDSPVGQKCPECARKRGTAQVITARQITGRATRLPPVTLGILIISIGVYVLGVGGLEESLFRNGQLSPRAVADGEWYRLLSSAFLHAGGFHILFNMVALYFLGPGIEREVGSASFAGLYVASALLGSSAYVLLADNAPAVGASGAVFGLFGAWLLSAWKERHTAMGRANLQSMGLIVGINLLLPFARPGIAWEAHVGGLVAGLVIAFAWTKVGKTAQARVLITVAVGAVALALGIVA